MQAQLNVKALYQRTNLSSDSIYCALEYRINDCSACSYSGYLMYRKISDTLKHHFPLSRTPLLIVAVKRHAEAVTLQRSLPLTRVIGNVHHEFGTFKARNPQDILIVLYRGQQFTCTKNTTVEEVYNWVLSFEGREK